MARTRIPSTPAKEFDELREELARWDAKVTPLDDEMVKLQRLLDGQPGRVERAEAELRMEDLQQERLAVWSQRQRVARRFAVARAVEEERVRRAERAKRARREIERAQTKLEVLRIVGGDLHDLFAKLVPGKQMSGLPGGESAFGLLGKLVFGRMRPGSHLHAEVQRDLERARRDLAEAEGRA